VAEATMDKRELTTRLEEAEEILGITEAETKRDETAAALRHVLHELIDVLRGAMITGYSTLPISSAAVARAAFERMVLAYWIATDVSNAQDYAGESKNELARQIRKLIEKKVAKTTDVDSGEDTTKRTRSDPALANLTKRRGMEEMARAAGIEDLFSTFYGWISMLAHGNTFNLPIATTEILSMTEYVTAASAAAVSHVTRRWYIDRKPAAKKQLLQIFGIREE
jgi:hypothetical protein